MYPFLLKIHLIEYSIHRYARLGSNRPRTSSARVSRVTTQCRVIGRKRVQLPSVTRDDKRRREPLRRRFDGTLRTESVQSLGSAAVRITTTIRYATSWAADIKSRLAYVPRSAAPWICILSFDCVVQHVRNGNND